MEQNRDEMIEELKGLLDIYRDSDCGLLLYSINDEDTELSGTASEYDLSCVICATYQQLCEFAGIAKANELLQLLITSNEEVSPSECC